LPADPEGFADMYAQARERDDDPQKAAQPEQRELPEPRERSTRKAKICF
jgi:hypothetical protein